MLLKLLMKKRKKMKQIVDALRRLAEDLNADISLSSTRIEHIRVSSRANEANNILYALEELVSSESSEA